MQGIRKPAGLTYTLLFLVVSLATIMSLFATLSVRPATAQDPAVVEEVIDEETVDEVPAAEPAAGPDFPMEGDETAHSGEDDIPF